MKNAFASLDLFAVEEMLLVLIEKVTGLDVRAAIADHPVKAAAALEDFCLELAELFGAVRLGLEDGKLTREEANEIVRQALEMPAAARAILASVGLGKPADAGATAGELPPADAHAAAAAPEALATNLPAGSPGTGPDVDGNGIAGDQSGQ